MVVTKRQQKLVKELETMNKTGQTLKGAMLASGYSLGIANRGWDGVPDTVLALLTGEGSRLARIGKQLSMQDCKHLVLGRLAENCVKGKDGGVMSAKTLGSHKELNLWVQDSQIGVIVLGAPNVPLPSEPPKLDE